ncbi:hypothetical protein ED733_004085 [Metarhizium rileyi]|uniref:Uncharacterized protein n=1 Tax=Metarhizium rileyi (strain RCEF 4871) TaxID=1649241 RepID=A0A5C6G8I2_METRR|nr:hypothetical protein ED733_004085 [Metarhizium rileyi]
MATYTISVINESSQRQRFVLYQASPFGDAEDGFGNVWMQVTVNEGGDTQNLKITAEYFAWAGSTETPLQSGVVVSGGKALPATLGRGDPNGSTFQTAVHEQLRQFNVNIQEIDPTAPAGAYTIHTRDDFDVGDTRVLIGLGKKDQNGRSIPVASLNPLPNTRYNLTPILKGVIAVNTSSSVGEALAYQAISDMPGVIDFSSGKGQGKFVAVVIFTARGKFEVDYA